MARQRLMVGTYGEISCFRLKSGSWQADGGPGADTLGYYRSHVRWILDPDKTEHPLGGDQLRHVRPVIIQAALNSASVSPDLDVSPHSFRRTVATEIDEVYDAEAAMNQLGHTSRVSPTGASEASQTEPENSK